ncbi:MAG: hypothetical protein ACM3S1_00840 [Hyphomicrobiales bacterium]
MHTVEIGEGVFVYGDGRIGVVPAANVELPDMEASPRPIARFVAGRVDIPDQEIEDRIRTGMANQ